MMIMVQRRNAWICIDRTTKEDEMIKTKETRRGKTKIIVSGKHAHSLYNLLERMSVGEIEKYIDGEESCDVCNIWYALEQVYSPQCNT